MDQEWKDLNVSLGLCPHLSVNDALCELVMNALDAAPTSVPEFATQGPSTVVLRDQGPGLALESFTVGRTHGDGKVVGRFGLGLKDAVAVLMRNHARVEIASQLGSYCFEVRQGALGTQTIHVRQREADGTGTCITVSNLQRAAQSVDAVQALFLCWSQPELLHSSGGVDVLQSPKQSGKQRGKLFVNGVAVTPPQPLFLSYNFKTATLDQRMACDRDHNVEGSKFTKLFQEPIQAALLSFPRQQQNAGPPKPSCEFAWKVVRERFFPEATTTSVSVGRPRAVGGAGGVRAIRSQLTATQQQLRAKTDELRAATNEQQRLCQQLDELARLPAPPDLPDRPSSVSARSSSQPLTGPVSRAEVDRLIQTFSQDDAVPEGHKRMVHRLSTALQVRHYAVL